MSQDATIRKLAESLSGRLLQPDDDGYAGARRVWNAMIDRRPALIVQAASAADVSAAVRYAGERGHTIAVRGGGHNIAGSAVCDDGVLIDLSLMRGIRVDAKQQTALVEGGALLSDLDQHTQAHGLATPAGVVSSTGVAGLTLGGGFGWLSRKHGLSADNVLWMELVTADGQLLRADDAENSDLFWALRGGGGNFGVVTRFAFRLHPLAGEVLFGPTLYRLDDAPAVLRHYRDFCRDAPRECCVWAALLTAPPLPILPERFHGTPVLSLMQSYAGDPETGRSLLAGLHTAAQPIGDAVAPRPYCEAQQFLDDTYAHGARNYWSSQSYGELHDDTIDTLVRLAQTMPTPESDILVSLLGGAIDDVAPEATAYPHRGIAFAVTPGARWQDPADDAHCISWARESGAALAAGASGGRYVNFVAEPDGAERSAYGASFTRLQAVKRRYDPDNRFRMNQNVAPDQPEE